MENRSNRDYRHDSDTRKDTANTQSHNDDQETQRSPDKKWNSDWAASETDTFNATNRNNEQGQLEDVNMSSIDDFEDISENMPNRQRTPGL